MNTASPPPSDTRLRWFRIAVVVSSVVVASMGSALLATRDSGDTATTRGVTATLQVPSHPGWLAAGEDAVWLALNRDAPDQPVGDKPLLRLDLATGIVERRISVGGEASYVTRAGNRLIASVRHVGQDELGGRLLFSADWRTGDVVVRRGFDGPVDHLASSRGHLWALEVRPGVLLRLDPVTLAPTAPPLRLSSGRTLDVAVGEGYVWVTAADDGELLRIDPETLSVARVDVGGFPVGVVVAGGSVWYADRETGEIAHLDPRELRAIDTPTRVGGTPSWLAAAGGSVFVSDAEDGTVSRIDARSGRKVGASIRVAPSADDATFAMVPVGSSVWVSSFASNTVTRIDAAPSRAPSRNVVVSGVQADEGAASALPRGARVVATIAVPPGGGALAAGEGAVWSMSDPTSTLVRIDPRTNTVDARIRLIGAGNDAAAGNGAVWVSHTDENSVSRIDPSTNTVTATVRVGPKPAGLAISRNAVWVANIGGPSVSRIDPATNRVVATIRVGPRTACCAEHMSITVGSSAVWVAVPNFDALVRIDPATSSVTHTVNLRYSPCAYLVADEAAVWSAGGGCGDVLARLDARTSRLTTTVDGELHPIGLALDHGSLWVASLLSARIDRLDPVTGRVVATLPVGGRPIRLVAGFGAIWVQDEVDRVLRIEPQD